MQSTENKTTYFVEHCTMPFCKGCGHSHVLRKLNDAMVKLALPPSQVCLVTDIGCIGLADGLFETPHTVHTTHGRSPAFATGIKMADSVLADSALNVVVLIGDGGAMIGLLHLVEAARLNINITVLLCNNFLFGMTGGQHSSFSPLDFVTPTTPGGTIIPPIDICKMLAATRAEFIARKLATDADLSDTIGRAIAHKGFSLVEIVELCTEHATTRNELTGSTLRDTVLSQGQEFGLLAYTHERPDFGNAYKAKLPGSAPPPKDELCTPQFESSLAEQLGIVIAGSAGERVQSAARKLCDAALLSGLYCTQKNDNPVTQGSGFSLAEVIISPAEIHYTGIEDPSAVIVVSQDGLDELLERDLFERLSENCQVVIDSSLPVPATRASVHRSPFRKEFGGNKAALRAIEHYLKLFHAIPRGAFNVEDGA